MSDYLSGNLRDVPEPDDPPESGGLVENVGAQPGGGSDQPEQTIVFEDLTLADALAYFVWRPVQTGRLLWRVLMHDPEAEAQRQQVVSAPDVSRDRDEVAPPVGIEPVAERQIDETPDVAEASDDDLPAFVEAETRGWFAAVPREVWAWIGALMVAVLLALRGGSVLHDAALNPIARINRDTNGAGTWFLLAGVIYACVELWGSRRWWARRFPALHRQLWSRFHDHDLPHVWVVGAIIVAVAFVGLALDTNNIIAAGVLLILALASWLVAVLGTHPLPDGGEEATAKDAAGGAGDHDDVFVVRSVERLPEQPEARLARSRALAWLDAHAFRLLVLPVALLFSALALGWNVSRDSLGRVSDVVITTRGAIAWGLSVALWLTVLGADWRRVPAALKQVGIRIRWRGLLGWPVLAILVIIALGAYFRLHDLASTPPEMTSDHIEKLLDSLRVYEGYRGVFFPNNGGREAFQMYLVAFIAGPLGVGFSFDALKLATVVEGLATLPALWWMARQVVGTETAHDRQLGHWIGLALAGLVAISSWHVMLSRLGLRIALTPLTTALVIGFLARAMRQDRTRDWLALGAVLGAGVYFYQANRMLPILVVAGFGMPALAGVRSPRALGRRVVEVFGFAVLVVAPLLAVMYVANAGRRAAVGRDVRRKRVGAIDVSQHPRRRRADRTLSAFAGDGVVGHHGVGRALAGQSTVAPDGRRIADGGSRGAGAVYPHVPL